MGIKKKSKVNAEFNMSSLTDIIFLLLIFFMLTSSMIIPNALNLKLPGKKSSSKSTPKTPSRLTIDTKGTYYLDGNRASLSAVEKKMRALKKNGSDASISVTPSKKSPNQSVVAVLDAAYRYGVSPVLTDPK